MERKLEFIYEAREKGDDVYVSSLERNSGLLSSYINVMIFVNVVNHVKSS